MMTSRYGLSLLVSLAAILSGAALTSCGSDRGIPVLVTVRAPSGALLRSEVTAALDGTPFAAVSPTNPTKPFVLYLPSNSHGQLSLVLVGTDAEGCTSEGGTSLAVQPVSGEALSATIEIDAKEYPKCALTVTVLGSGAVVDRDQSFRCLSEAPAKPCTHLYHKNDKVVLVGEEGGIDQYLDEWHGACGCSSDECALTMEKPQVVNATFGQRICQPDGACVTVPPKDAQADPAPIFSLNALWGAVGTTLTYYPPVIVPTQPLSTQLSSPAYALWGTRDMVWVFTKDRQILSCEVNLADKLVQCTSRQNIAKILAKPATLFSFGGDATGEFWAVDKRSVYRCHKDLPCDLPMPLAATKNNSTDLPDKILTAFLRGSDVIVGGQESRSCDKTCSYFVRGCANCSVASFERSEACPPVSSIPLRYESGDESAMWVKVSTSLFRVDGTSNPLLEKNLTKGKCLFFPRMAVQKKGIPGVWNTWIVGDDGQVSRVTNSPGPGLTCLPVPTNPGAPTLRAAWLSTSDAWIVGDQGTVLRCPLVGPGTCKSLPGITKLNLVQVSGDNAGKVWAMAGNGTQVPINP